MEPLKISVSVPFLADKPLNSSLPCMKQFSSKDVTSYESAIGKEIISSAESTDDLQVLEIEFVNGSFTHLSNDAVSKIFNLIKKHFNVHPRVKLSLAATPAGFDFFTLFAARTLGAEIKLWVPSTDENELASIGFSSSEVCLSVMDCCYQNGFRDYTVTVSPKFNTTYEIFKKTIKDVVVRKPTGILVDSSMPVTFLEASQPILTGNAYAPYSRGWFSIPPKAQRRYPQQIGLGPGAVSYFNGQSIKSTSDFEYYCANSDNFEALVTHK